MDDLALFEEPKGKQHLHNEACNALLAVEWKLEGAEGVAIDVLHGDVVVVSLAVGGVVAYNIGMIEAFCEYLRLIFDLLHFPTIILTVKLQSDLGENWLTFFTA